MERMKVIGKQELDFIGRDGNPVQGTKLHCVTKKDYVEGEAIEGIFINIRSDYHETAKNLPVGTTIEVGFNRRGKPESVHLCK